MVTRKEVASRIQARGFTAPEELLELDDYEFEQWCGRTAKGDLTDSERSWLASNIDLAARWVDGLDGLIDSAETQMEHAEDELERARRRLREAHSTSAISAAELELAELEQTQAAWKLKIGTFTRKVKKTRRTAARNLARLERRYSNRSALIAYIEELEAAIATHRDSFDPEDADEADKALWAHLEEVDAGD